VNSLPSSIAHNVSRLLGANGPCTLISTGCASGADAIGTGFEYVRSGQTAVAFAGASEAPIEPLTVYAFDAIGALSRHNQEPQKASRPFDLKRDGFVIGEGCGLLVLEELHHALQRDAHIYGEIIGYETTCDAYHMTGSLPDNREAVRGIRLALDRAGIPLEEVDYVSAHGTSTPMNDKSETEIIRQVFGPHAYHLAVSSIKSMIGHLSGAAGSVQAVSCALALEHQMLPPTINYEWPDPACDLDYVPNFARPSKVHTVLQDTFGFSGKNSALLYRRFC
jgi:3-oxoacyl-(acyl-carrier-protein) synthase